MKLFYKVVCGAAAVCIGLGAILGGAGLLMGGTIRGLFQAGDTSAFSWGPFSWSAPSWWGSDTVRESYDGIRSLDFDLGPAAVTIREGDAFTLEARRVNADRFQTRVDGDTWEIQCPDQGRGSFSGSGGWDQRAPEIIITVPEGFVAEELDLAIGMGTLEAQGLSARESSLSVGMGEMVLSGFSSGDCGLEVGMGTLELSGAVTGRGSVDCGMGTALLTLEGDPGDYDYRASAGLGSVTVGDRSGGGLGSDLARDTGAPNYFEIDCGMGEVVLHFR